MAEARTLTPVEERLIELGNSLWKDTSPTGLAFREAARARWPEAVTPESQIEPALKPALDKINEMMAEIAADRRAAKEKAEADEAAAAERTLAQRVDAAAREFRLTDQGREMMLARMNETGNHTDPAAAAAYIVQANPPPRDLTGLLGPQNKVNLFGQGQVTSDERMKTLLNDPRGRFLDDEFKELLTNPRQFIIDAGLPDPGEIHY